MLPAFPRVAYLPDSFYEINGVAHTSRQYYEFALRAVRPFFCLRPAQRGAAITRRTERQMTTLDVPRDSPFAFRLEQDLTFDPAFLLHARLVEHSLREFRPDLIHITGPSESGLLGFWLARRLKVPLVASWHTNLHEYAAHRASRMLGLFPTSSVEGAERRIERAALTICTRFYRRAQILFAPNVDLCRLLEGATGRRCALMPRGVDSMLFSPELRDRSPEDHGFVLGFCGRLSVEKNVYLLARIREQLIAQGITCFRFVIVGHGKEENWLRDHLPNAQFTGILRGHHLARAYANMDLFVFPSHTDTFGNVVLEALASGVPAIVTPDGGPRYIVNQGETGFIAEDSGFAEAIARMIVDPALHARMRQAARRRAETASWDAVFEGVYRNYEAMLDAHRAGVALAPQAVTSVPVSDGYSTWPTYTPKGGS